MDSDESVHVTEFTLYLNLPIECWMNVFMRHESVNSISRQTGF